MKPSLYALRFLDFMKTRVISATASATGSVTALNELPAEKDGKDTDSMQSESTVQPKRKELALDDSMNKSSISDGGDHGEKANDGDAK